jgi:hypothetical protein
LDAISAIESSKSMDEKFAKTIQKSALEQLTAQLKVLKEMGRS